VCCSVLQCVAVCAAGSEQSVAVCRSVLLVCYSALQCVLGSGQRVECCSVLQCVAVCGSVWQCVVVCGSVLQCNTVCCSVLQCVAVC